MFDKVLTRQLNNYKKNMCNVKFEHKKNSAVSYTYNKKMYRYARPITQELSSLKKKEAIFPFPGDKSKAIFLP